MWWATEELGRVPGGGRNLILAAQLLESVCRFRFVAQTNTNHSVMNPFSTADGTAQSV
jgi:hypothetical protein